jgi:iron complex transport system substrate-binding protein
MGQALYPRPKKPKRNHRTLAKEEVKSNFLFNEILGTDVNVPEKPLRIVSLSPAITEILFMLGLGDKVVGVSAFCARPAEARKKKKFGSYSTVNTKLLESVKTDLIFAITGYQRNLAFDLASKKFPVYPLELPTSVAGIIDMVTKVGLVTGEHTPARALSAQLIKSLSKIEPISKPLKVLVEIDLGGPVSFGAYSYITDALNLVGARSLYGDARSEWTSIDLSSIPKENPDAFIYEAKMYSHFVQSDLDALITKRGWSELDFVKKENYFLTPGPLDFLAHHGPSFVTDVIPWLAQRLKSAEDTA